MRWEFTRPCSRSLKPAWNWPARCCCTIRFQRTRFSASVKCRGDLYQPLRQGPLSRRYRELLTHLRTAGDALELDWVTIPDAATVTGSTIGEVGIRKNTGASAVAVLRREIVTSNPGPDWVIEPADMLALLGTAEQRAEARALLQEVNEVDEVQSG